MASQSANVVDIWASVSKRFTSNDNAMNVLPWLNIKCLNSFGLSGCYSLGLAHANCSICCSNTIRFTLVATNYSTYSETTVCWFQQNEPITRRPKAIIAFAAIPICLKRGLIKSRQRGQSRCGLRISPTCRQHVAKPI